LADKRIIDSEQHVIVENKKNKHMKEKMPYMKKKKYKNLLIHSLELHIFLLELDKNLLKFNIEKDKNE